MMRQPDTGATPQHIAIIMDGNGRWARLRGRERFYGHIKGARVAKKIIEHCARRKIGYLTLYTFSEENWSRPVIEINFLMRLLIRYVRQEKITLVKNNIKFLCVGNLSRLPDAVRKELQEAEEVTKNNSGMVLTFALSYGGRQELTDAVRSLAVAVADGHLLPADITEAMVEQHLQTFPNPDPDLLIRTSGEWRLSNFLPWQTVYSELFFTNTLWPDFSLAEFENALRNFAHRERRYGAVKEQGNGARLTVSHVSASS